MHLNFKSLSEQKNSKTEVNLKQFLKKTRFIVKTNYRGNLHLLAPQILKVFIAIANDFKRHFFLVMES